MAPRSDPQPRDDRRLERDSPEEPGVARLVSVRVGRIAPLGPDRVPSGFVKHPATDALAVGRLGLEGDAQADLSVHGGPEKAVYAYPAAHYEHWKADFPAHRDRLVPGAFGENLTIAGLTENDVCVGDIHAIGSAKLQVCQPRQPCFKLALFFEDNRLPRAMVRTGRAGWYYRVMEEGRLRTGDAVRLIERPNPLVPFARLIEVIADKTVSAEEARRIGNAAGLANQWRDALLARAKAD